MSGRYLGCLWKSTAAAKTQKNESTNDSAGRDSKWPPLTSTTLKTDQSVYFGWEGIHPRSLGSHLLLHRYLRLHCQGQGRTAVVVAEEAVAVAVVLGGIVVAVDEICAVVAVILDDHSVVPVVVVVVVVVVVDDDDVCEDVDLMDEEGFLHYAARKSSPEGGILKQKKGIRMCESFDPNVN